MFYYYSLPKSMNSNFRNQKSLAKIDLDALRKDPNASTKVWRVLKNGQAEVIALRRRLNSDRMRIYRAKQKAANLKTLLSRIQQRQSRSGRFVSEIVKVSMSD